MSTINPFNAYLVVALDSPRYVGNEHRIAFSDQKGGIEGYVYGKTLTMALARADFVAEACNQHAALKLREKALVEACLLALELIRNHFPLEHGDPKIAATWGALESAIEKCRLAFALPLANAGPNLKAGQIRSGHHSSNK